MTTFNKKKTHFALFNIIVFRLKMIVGNNFTTYHKLLRNVAKL